MGSDNITTATAAANNAFQSTLPGWGATGRILGHGFPVGISIHAPRMGSDASTGNSSIRHSTFQSTLPGWGATVPRQGSRDRVGISIHAPRMGSDLRNPIIKAHRSIFQSTLPGWGATTAALTIRHHVHDFNPRSPDGERRQHYCGLVFIVGISIHAPRMGSDRENGHLRPRYGQNHPFSTLIVSQIVVDVLGTVRKSQKHQRTSHYEVIKQPERQK